MNVRENPVPGFMMPESQMPFDEPGNAPPVPEVEVCVITPVFLQRTVSPTLIVIVLGRNENSSSETLWAVPGADVVVVVGGGVVVVVVGGGEVVVVGGGEVVVVVGGTVVVVVGGTVVVVVGGGAVVVVVGVAVVGWDLVGVGGGGVVVVGGWDVVVAISERVFGGGSVVVTVEPHPAATRAKRNASTTNSVRFRIRIPVLLSSER